MPTITHTEIAAVSAAVLLLYVAPFLLATVEAYRRRKAQRLTAVFSLPEPTPSTVTAQPDTEEPTAALAAAPIDEAVAHASDTEATPPEMAQETTAGAPGEPTTAPWRSAPETTDPTGGERLASPDGSIEAPAAKRFDGNEGHRFRLEDLHQARLEGWPPATIRDDAAQRQIWNEAQQVANTHPVVFSSVLVAPCQVRSVCLGAAEKHGTGFRLCFLLFPGLWPASRDQAVSQAVFEIDSITGEVQHWIELLR